jgi:ribosomal-protein-alanine N-acetyltransferase
MIKEITNIEDINNSFINYEYINNEYNNNPYFKLLVIEEKKVIGYLYYSEIYERIEINQIEVEESYRNKGYGTKLLDYLINNSDKSITLEVRKDNYPAIALYKKFNFKEVALRKNYYNGIDGILMERKREKVL